MPYKDVDITILIDITLILERCDFMKYIPNILSAFRIFFSLFLIHLNPKKLLFILIYIICGISDILDGFIARKINATSKLGAKLDSIADIIMIFVILFKFVPTMSLNLFMILWFVVIFFIKISCIFIVYFRFKEFGMVHTYMNKLTGILIFIYPVLNYFIDCKAYIFMIFVVASLTAIEEILIDLTMDTLDLDRKFYFNIK